MMHRCTVKVVALLSLLLILSVMQSRAAEPAKTPRVPVLLDTDLGGDIDDAFALALVLNSPELDLRGVTTVHGDAHTRALIACRMLHALGRDAIPVASGRPARETPDFTGQMQYGLRPCFRKRPVKESAVEFLYQQLKAHPGELTLLAVGPLTNVAELLAKHPDCKPWIKRIIIMGGAVRVGYNGKPPAEVEWNVKCDIKAAQAVFASGVPLVVAPLDATTELKVDEAGRRAFFGKGTRLANELHALYQLWGQPTPTLFDPVAVALCFTEKFTTMEELRLEVDDKGITRPVKGKPNARVATAVRRGEFLKWCLGRAGTGDKGVSTALKPVYVAAPVARGNFPNRVHVAEDYETDIERRWWLCGKLETKDVPPGSTRACRGVWTNDFDDKMGEPKAMYTAVIFNPVPGPPMGKNTRLGFCCKLKGTSQLRVQIYSLTNGYHRCLTLTDLPQGKWQELTADLTKARRPDGSGGPLSQDERIDDIQFYADPSAELLIDDVVLYDAAEPGERRPFPRRLHFTGWFDTGKQGKEWPGSFDIVPHEKPRKWKAARPVVNKETGEPWVRLHLRGERPLGESARLRFRYKLTGTDTLRIALAAGGKVGRAVVRQGLAKGEWAEATVDLGAGPGKGGRADEVRFLLPKGAELLLDDVLLYETGDGEKR